MQSAANSGQRGLLQLFVMEEPIPLKCVDKLVFSTQKEALTAATVAQFQYGSRLRSYRCRICKLWHLASKYEDD